MRSTKISGTSRIVSRRWPSDVTGQDLSNINVFLFFSFCNFLLPYWFQNLRCFLVYRYKVGGITPAKISVDPRITSLYTKTADLIGIDEAREELITRLTKGDDMSMQQRIVSVVGFGGLGKTTLAKVMYDKLKGQFDCMAFVPVGRNPDLKKVFKDMSIDLDTRFNVDVLDERQLIDKLQEFLENKRCVSSATK